MPDEHKSLIMHVTLPLGENSRIMGSDTTDFFSPDFTVGNNFAISIGHEDPSKGEAYFNALAEGGKVIMPYAKTFWGAYFGQCTDQFGIKWMVNCEIPAEERISTSANAES